MGKLFGTSGVRRRVSELPPEFVIALARALATYTPDEKIVIGRDTRKSGPLLESAFISGLISSGKNVIDICLVPTPTVGVATAEHGTGVMVTASHNPPEYNGFKFWNTSGAYNPEQENAVEKIFFSKKFKKGKRCGVVEKRNYVEKHINLILKKIGTVNDVRVLVDCAGGAGSVITPKLLEKMGCDVIAINTNQDGNFPHELEPTAENLAETCKLVKKKKVDIAFAHDGDADRTAAIGKDGKLIEWDSFLSVLAYDLDRVVTTVDASMRIEDVCNEVIRTKVGDVFVAEGIRKNNADFGGEPSGAYIFPDIHIFPDGIATVAKTVSMVADGFFYERLEEIKSYPMERVKIPCGEDEKGIIMDNLKKIIKEDYDDTDGIRISTDEGWILIRPSGTEPYVRITAEGVDRNALDELVGEGREWIGKARK